MDTQTISLTIDIPADADRAAFAAAIRDAADRAAGQVEHEIVPYPLEVDDTILLAMREQDEFGAQLFRSE
ncbi:MAG TPA: hypothetical protein VFE72_04255 [Lysobacter sp.]|nr:hypothetical protein [Lysobacter sp.]